MSIERRFAHEPGVVFDALVMTVGALEKLRDADRAGLVIQFATRTSGFSWGSKWTIRLQLEVSNTLAAAAIIAPGSLVAAMTERKRIQLIWDRTQELLDERVGKGVIAPAPALATPEERAEADRAAADGATRRYGTVLTYERFGGAQVRILSGGFIQLGDGEPQRLLRIEENFLVQQKTGVGRLAAAVVTNGMNILVTGNKRGTLYLSFVTDKGAGTLREDPPTDSGIKRGSALALAGRAAIDNTRAQPTGQVGTPVGPAPTVLGNAASVPERLARAQELRDQGLISEDEYAATRAQILTDL